MTKRHLALICVSAVLVLICGLPGFAQVTTGAPPLGTMGSGGADQIDLANLDVHISVPIMNKRGRGVPFTYSLSYDSSVWYPVTSGSTHTWQPVLNWGWTSQSSATTGYLSFTMSDSMCYSYDSDLNPIYDGDTYSLQNFVYHDSFGTSHQLDYSETDAFSGYGNLSGSGLPVTYSNCSTYSSSSGSQKALDGSDYSIQGTYWSWQMVAPSGNVMTMPYNMQSGAASLTDANGNQVSVNGSGQFFDTLSSSTPVLTVGGAGTQSSPHTFQYAAPSGTATYTMKYTNENVKTNFGCSGITEYSANNVPLVTEIDLPDQAVNTSDRYTFTYEATPSHSGYYTGRIASVTLPTGGTITYSYSGGNNGIVCADGSTATLTRSTPDTGSSDWTYAHSESGTAWTTTITDPQSTPNQTVMNFQGIYPTETQVYQGTTSGTLLKTAYTCYNNATPNCNSIAITLPITQANTYVQWPGSGGLESEIAVTYNSYGLATEKDEYAYGAGSPGSVVRKTLTSYNTSLTNGIVDRPAQVAVEDGSGTVKAETNYSYDGTGVTATSGTPQLVSISGSRGNVTTISSLISGASTLSKSFTYYDTGNVYTATDVNSATTTYNYGSSSCGNSFATSVSEPLSLSKSVTWNCTGGVATAVTDENGNTVSDSYTSAYFWRPDSATDQLSNVTNFTYAPTSVESSMSFNSGNSITDQLVTLDSLGRSQLSQTKEGPSSSTYDSVETDYDSVGRPNRATLPFGGTAGGTSSSAPGKNTTYDALGRAIQTTDSGGLSATTSYPQNDALTTAGPAPTSENTKKKQYEYDALGRLTSVCEITSGTTAAPAGTCAQTSSQTGYWTTYTYDLNNNLTGVTQNAQSSTTQTRSYTYDDLGRVTAETNPESGITVYTYDTDSTCGTSYGDLVKVADQVGNVTCYTYDALHRVTSMVYPSGSYASVTPSRYYVYDSATVNSVAMSNAKTHLAEAYTCTSCPGTKMTDMGFSYTARGETSDLYQSTPHSSGYYHSAATYWANGLLNGLTGALGYATNYTPDGEGRIYSAGSGSHLTSTSYNAASQPTAVNFASGDSDAFSYDSNTDRMTQYSFNVNGSSVVGALTWNAIGTLSGLTVTDPFFTGGNETCSYTHDDLVRITSANCGSVWSQTFSFDAFGNLNKSGSSPFAPLYTTSPPTNQYSTIGSSSPYYDANGNVTNDFMHTYAWDSNGRPVTIDGVGATYNALGQMVEQNRSGSYTEIQYSPTGFKMLTMNGSSLGYAVVPMPGGTSEIWTGSANYYRHSDWLGSSRLASTYSRSVYFDGAYAPYGESYATNGTTDLSVTGMNQDTASNLYDFSAREYGIQGRWASPDPAGMAAVDPTDPRSWNRYAYVLNNPLALIDPTGEDPIDCSSDFNSCVSYCPSCSGGIGGGGGGTISCVPSTDPFQCGLSDPSNQGTPTGGAGGGSAGSKGQGNTSGGASVGNGNSSQNNNQKQACLNGYNNSLAGKTIQFVSLYNLATNFKKVWIEWALLPGLKVAAATAVKAVSQAVGNTEFLSITGGASTTIVAPTAAGVGVMEAGGSIVAPLAIAGATAADISIQNVCASNNLPLMTTF